jgi:prepilin-type N-terminal cleavage/methylation domain-containing protein
MIINKKGFTLIELIVTIGIIVFMSAFILANYRRAGDKTDLRAAAQKLMNDVKSAQSNALGLKKFNGNSPGGGWGVRFHMEDSSYIIFSDYLAAGDYGWYTDSNEKYQEINFNNNIKIKGKPRLDGTQRNYLYVVFEPPDPKVHINGSNPPNGIQQSNANEAVVTLENRRGDTIDIKINIFGLVDIQN